MFVLIVLLTSYLCLRPRPQDKGVGNPVPGPVPWPIIGSLHLMANFTKYPFEAFTNLQKIYGSIFQMRLGSMDTVIIHSEEDKKEVLVTKGDHFDGRPDFKRFDVMFGGDRRNSLAFCDFDKLQVARRKMMRGHTFPSAGGEMWSKLDKTCKKEMTHLMAAISDRCKGGEVVLDLKALVVKASSNIFNSYFCSVARHSYEDQAHNKYCEMFDKVFWEVNNGRACDFLPWLMPAMWKPMGEIKELTEGIRKFVVTELIEEREQNRGKEDEKNMVDCLLDQVEKDKDNSEDDECTITEDIALYALEDILGGHCAVANFALRAFINIAARPALQGALRQELNETLLGAEFSLAEKSNLPLMQATFAETIRTTCTPIVPHVANRDTTIGGYKVAANTVVFINNHYSNFHTDFWKEPETYNPHRFITEGRFVKPSHFQPFSVGRRSCMGYKMIDNLIATLLANIFSKFEVQCSESMLNMPGGMLALETKPFYFTVKRLENPARRNA